MRREQEVSSADLGENWPLTVERGTLVYEEPGAVLFVYEGTTYHLNGLAKGIEKRDHRGWKDIDPLWAHDPDAEPLERPADWDEEEEGPWEDYPWKRNIGPLIQRGLALGEG
jgi:hypothetical protein